MTRSPSTLILAGALAAACSKPNPLFLDTWSPVSDTDGPSTTSASTLTGGSVTTTESASTGTTAALTTTESGTTSTTGSTSTSSSSSSSSSGVGPTSDSTTGGPFFCDQDPQGCCEVRIEPEADSFFTDATDIAMQQDCPVGGGPPKCDKWSFGRAEELMLFNDGDGLMGPKGVSVMALRFPMEAGQLVVGGDVIPWSVVKEAVLELSVTTDWDAYDAFEFRLYWLPESDAWFEGDGMGPVTCFGDNSSFACRKCGPDPTMCVGWSTQKPIVDGNMIDELVAVQGAAPTLLELPIETPSSLASAHTGLVVLPSAVEILGQAYDVVPGYALHVKARESGTPPALRLLVCMN